MRILKEKPLKLTENKNLCDFLYGVSDKELANIQKKHDLQEEYLKNNYFVTASGQIKTFYDMSFSANHSERYYAEMQNKLNTMQTSIITDFPHFIISSVFLTATLDGFFRDFLVADFSRYIEDEHKKLIPNNDRFGFLRDKIKNEEKFTIKDLINCLSYQWFRFNKSKFRKSLKEKGKPFAFVKVFEPHKNGVPHLHFLVWLPDDEVENFKKYYKKYFPAPQNLKPIDKKDANGDLKGFISKTLTNPIGYVMKYVFKTFRNVKKGNKIDKLNAWFIKHRVLRVVLSRNIAPAWVYRKMIVFDELKDWSNLDYYSKNYDCEWDFDKKYIFVNSGVVSYEYNNGIYTKYIKNRIFKQFGQEKEKEIKIFKKIDLKYKKKIKEPKIIVDGKEYVQKDNLLVLKTNKLPVSKWGNYNLLTHYNKLKNDLKNCNLSHLYIVEKEIKKRDLLKIDKS